MRGIPIPESPGQSTVTAAGLAETVLRRLSVPPERVAREVAAIRAERAAPAGAANSAANGG